MIFLRVLLPVILWLVHLSLGELLSVHIIFRHGHRKPLEYYARSNNPNWNESGGLTDLGRRQVQHLGSRLRKEYRPLLHHNNGGNVFKKALIRSSALDRTETSAKIFSRAFFKTNDTIPLIVLPHEKDTLILQHAPCPLYDEARARLMALPPKEATDLLAKHSKALRVLAKRTGKKLNTIKEATFLLDAFLCEEQYNLTQPDWVKEMSKAGREEIMEMHQRLFTWTEMMKKAKAGPLITDIVDHLYEAVERRSLENIFIYVGHDITLSTLTRALGVDQQLPRLMELASALAFELHLIENRAVVKIRWFHPAGQSKDLYLDSCGILCPLNMFDEHCKRYYIEDYAEFCRLKTR